MPSFEFSSIEQFEIACGEWYRQAYADEAPTASASLPPLIRNLPLLMSVFGCRNTRHGASVASARSISELALASCSAAGPLQETAGNYSPRGGPLHGVDPAIMQQIGQSVARNILENLRGPQGGHDALPGLRIFGSPQRRGGANEEAAAGPVTSALADPVNPAFAQAAAGPVTPAFAQAAAGLVAGAGLGTPEQAAAGAVALSGARAVGDPVALLGAHQAAGAVKLQEAVGPAGPNCMVEKMREMLASAAAVGDSPSAGRPKSTGGKGPRSRQWVRR